MNYLKFALFFYVGSFAIKSFAFPEMVTHGYVSCTTCHISPSGGGVLSPYGKSLAKELVSSEKLVEETPADEASKMEQSPSPWIIGGDLRVLQHYLKNEFESKKAIIPMQAAVEVAFESSEKYFGVARFGIVGGSSGGEDEGEEAYDANRVSLFNYLPSYYLMYRENDVYFRVGKFLPFYGLNNSQHFFSPRGPLGFGFGDQRFTVEASYQKEEYALVLSHSGRRGKNELGESASLIQLQYTPFENSRVAVNIWKESDLRTIIGSWLVLPVMEKFVFLADLNRQNEKGTIGTFNYFKLSYEYEQGLHPYLVADFSQSNVNYEYSKNQKYGAGIQYFPMAGFEIDAVWMKEVNKIYSDKVGDYAYLLFHYYL